jgi:hypothetical protein
MAGGRVCNAAPQKNDGGQAPEHAGNQDQRRGLHGGTAREGQESHRPRPKKANISFFEKEEPINLILAFFKK